MLTPQLVIPLHRELVVDLFAGAGGASTGIEQAIGRYVDIAINHDPEAVALHQANHPQTQHYVSDVFEVDPAAVCDGRPIGLLWASPDCKHFSKAKGGKPVSKKIRGLAWVVIKWAKLPENLRPRVILLENVEEFQHWGPLDTNDMPCAKRKGRTFKRWRTTLENLGYAVDFEESRACDFGAPTIRKRLFLVARCDGQPIVFPPPTHGAPGGMLVRAKKLKPWRTAAECIDWDAPCPSIFTRDRPLAEATCRRIAKGVMRYVVESPDPFIVPLRALSLIAPSLMAIDNKGARTATWRANEPLRTTTTENRHALVTAFLAQHNTERNGHNPGRAATVPLSTITGRGTQQQLVTSNLIKLRGTSKGAQSMREPLHTVSAQGLHHAEVRAFLIKYYGTDQDPQLREPLHTVTTKHRFGLVMVHGEPYAIVDIGMRMLSPPELYRAQGFPVGFKHTHRADGVPLTKTAQVRMVGNSVSPMQACAYVMANYSEAPALRRAA